MRKSLSGWAGAAGVMLLVAGAGSVARAVQEPFPLRDATRPWGVTLNTRGEYDDNIHTAPSNTVSGWKGIIEPQLLLNLPGEQTFLGLRYNYRATVYEDRPGDEVDHAHTGNLILSHAFTPRLAADLRNRLVRGVEPELVETEQGVPLVTRRRGDYFYNDVNGSVRYNLSRRWVGSLEADWTLWRYDDAPADRDDRDLYSGTLGAAYAVDPRTTVGLNYRFLRIDYQQSGTNDLRNSDSHFGYVSLVHRFNPLLSGQLNAGAEYRDFGDGTTQTSPDVNANLSYAYARGSALTAGLRYGIATTEAAGYRSTDSLVGYGQVTHRLTPKFFAGANLAYTHSTFENPAPGLGLPSGTSESTLTTGVSLRYEFTSWCSASGGYSFDRVDSDVAGRGYDRNRAWLGLRLAY
ncbi:outer membrane beta-barrel protein [bacterium]|nr:outer membrane beta-barrel protein [bacterium]